MLALVAAMDAVVAQQAVELPPLQALADTAVLLAQVERLRGGLLSRVADVDARKLHRLAVGVVVGGGAADQPGPR